MVGFLPFKRHQLTSFMQDFFLQRTGHKLKRYIIPKEIIKKADDFLRPDDSKHKTDHVGSEHHQNTLFLNIAFERAKKVFVEVFEVVISIRGI
jgi:hypothetical protein